MSMEKHLVHDMKKENYNKCSHYTHVFCYEDVVSSKRGGKLLE